MITIIQLSDSFSSVLSEQTAARGLEISESPAEAMAAIVVAAGVEEEATSHIRSLRSQINGPVVVVGSATEHPLVITIMRAGPADYFALPGDLDRFGLWLDDVARARTARANAQSLAEQQRIAFDFSKLIGESPELRAALDRASKIIPRAGATVLITGETGTGKELLAQAIHYNSPRAQRPIIEVNCTALPANLLEAELFGYEKGAFTGAVAAKPGLFEAAQGGTLFLDEIGDLTLDLQAKLLRALETRQVRRLGSVRTHDVDVRIIAATHVNLGAAVRAGEFREDLYYRLNVVPIHLPPLRDRGNDIIILANAFMRHFAELYDMPVRPVDDAVRAALLAYPWPGNIRELKNSIERALLLGDGAVDVKELVPRGATSPQSAPSPIPFPARMEDIETQAALAMVRHCEGNKTAAAAALGISRARLYRLIGEEEG